MEINQNTGQGELFECFQCTIGTLFEIGPWARYGFSLRKWWKPYVTCASIPAEPKDRHNRSTSVKYSQRREREREYAPFCKPKCRKQKIVNILACFM